MRAGLGPWLAVVMMLGCHSAGAPRVEPGPAAESSQTAGSGDCLKEGEGDSAYGQQPGVSPGSAPERACCPGLTRLDGYESSAAPGQCLLSKGGRYVCTQCGDGRCREGENSCNCPKDCP